ARTILDQGVALDALRFAGRYLELIEQEHGFLLHHLILPAVAAGRRDQVSATLAHRSLRLIEAYLRRQFRRRTGLYSEAWMTLPDPLTEPAVEGAPASGAASESPAGTPAKKGR